MKKTTKTAERPALLKGDEVSRARFYDQMLMSGLYLCESRSTSSRSSRGRK